MKQIGKAIMTIKRGDYGLFAQKGDEQRKVRSLRLTDTTWDTLGQIAESKEATRADLIEELATTYYTASDDTQRCNTREIEQELEELREWKVSAERCLQDSDGWRERLSELQRANIRNSGEAEQAQERALRAEQELEKLKAELAAVKSERDGFDKEIHTLHEKVGDLDLELTKAKVKIAELQSQPTDQQPELALELPDKYTLKSRLMAKHPLFKGTKVKDDVMTKYVELLLKLLEG